MNSFGPISDTARSRRLRERYGPWALVTGASDGMGRELSGLLASAGFSLVIVARRGALLDEMAARLIDEYGVEVIALELDMSRTADIKRLLSETEGLEVGLVVAAAGYGTSGPFAASDVARELDMLDVNCRAVLSLVHAYSGRLLARGKGGIVLFGSLVAWQGVAFAANYAATKAYVQALAEGLRIELAPYHIEVLSVAPGPVSSGFARRAGMHMGAATSASAAATGIFRSLGRSGTVVPGALGKLLTYSLAPLPRSLRIRIMAQVMRGMTVHHEAEKEAATRPSGSLR
jgi:hypothetical protein